jgi:hypothetical protein
MRVRSGGGAGASHILSDHIFILNIQLTGQSFIVQPFSFPWCVCVSSCVGSRAILGHEATMECEPRDHIDMVEQGCDESSAWQNRH